MAISGVSETDYRRFLAHGGTLIFEVDAEDIDSSRGFESSPLIQPYLESGFELKPSPIINEPREKAMLFLYGGSWTRVITRTYLDGGTITYKKLPSGRYEANVVVPENPKPPPAGETTA